jgi:copper chaperone CopZ
MRLALITISLFSFYLLSSNSLKAIEKTTNNERSSVSSHLHRLDFRVEGKSCAACLLAIQRKINSLPGVKRAVVMLKRPFGASVIYQDDQIKQEEILVIVKDKEPNVKIVDINDSGIANIPSVIIPPFVPTPEIAK